MYACYTWHHDNPIETCMRGAYVMPDRRMHEELKAGAEAGAVTAQVAGCVGTALRLLAEKAEYMAATGEPFLWHTLELLQYGGWQR